MILVTAATGQVGSIVVDELSRRNIAARAMVRDLTKARKVPGISWVQGAFDHPLSMDAALEGIDVMYLACAAGSCQADLECEAIDAARRNGVRRVVKLSAFDAHDANPSDFRRWNGIAETHLRNSGLAWTILRPTAFSQSLDPGGVVEKGELLAPQGVASTPYIDARDIAEIAAVALTEAGHEGRIYDLTGPEALSGDETAALIGKVFGCSVSCRSTTDAEAYASLLAAGVDEQTVRSYVVHWQSYRARPVTLISGWTEILTRHPPRTLEAWLEECRTDMRQATLLDTESSVSG